MWKCRIRETARKYGGINELRYVARRAQNLFLFNSIFWKLILIVINDQIRQYPAIFTSTNASQLSLKNPSGACNTSVVLPPSNFEVKISERVQLLLKLNTIEILLFSN